VIGLAGQQRVPSWVDGKKLKGNRRQCVIQGEHVYVWTKGSRDFGRNWRTAGSIVLELPSNYEYEDW
jgi:hypothetical protein